MFFNSMNFALFYPLVLVCYFLLPTRRTQNFLLLVASYFFYACWDPRFLALLLLTTCVDYQVGRMIGLSSDAKYRSRVLWISIVINFTVLGFFKYFNFFQENLIYCLSQVGIQVSPWSLNVILPIGLSFYTIQSVSYVMDVYRKEIKASEDFWDFALFVSFFPHMVAGPIQRASTLLSQIQKERTFVPTQLSEGAFLIVVGLFQKMVVADNLSGLVDDVFREPHTHSASRVWIAMYCFAFQVYCDFAGYSKVAKGTAKIMGFELMQNFNVPYLAKSFTDFWKRWHISLSECIRDNVFQPIAVKFMRTFPGRPKLAFAVSSMVSMTLSGFWHGANWTMVVWGALHGALMVAERFFVQSVGKKIKPHPVITLLTTILVFHLVCFAWVFFRSPSLSAAFDFFSAIAQGPMKALGKGDSLRLLLVAGMLFLDLLEKKASSPFFCARWHWLPRSATISLLLLATILFGDIYFAPFIYFQF